MIPHTFSASSSLYDFAEGSSSTGEAMHDSELEQCLLENEQSLVTEADLLAVIRLGLTAPAPKNCGSLQTFCASTKKQSALDFRLDSNDDVTPEPQMEVEIDNVEALPFLLQQFSPDSGTEIDIEPSTEIQVDFPDPVQPVKNKAINADDRKRLALIKRVYSEILAQRSVARIEDLKLTLLESVAEVPSQYEFEAVWNKVLKPKRCNQTRYVTNILRLMAQALLDTYEGNNQLLALVPSNLEKCTRICNIQDVINHRETPEFKAYLTTFLQPEDNFVRLVQRIDYTPYIKMLILEALPVLKLLLNSSKPVSSWKMEKIEVRGEYSAAKDILQRGGSLEAVQQAVEHVYLKIKSKIKVKACSNNNNTIHYQVQAINWMLNCIMDQIKGKLETAQSESETYELQCKIRELEGSISQLAESESKSSIAQATSSGWIRRCIREDYLQTNALLLYFLDMTTVNTLCVYNLVSKFKEFAQVFNEAV